MKFSFKIQDYQTEAVNAVLDVFNGQAYSSHTLYTRDLGNKPQVNHGKMQQVNFLESFTKPEIEDTDGFRNNEILLSREEILKNIHTLQNRNNIKLSQKLVQDLGACSLDIEMETGTGKTYVYLKTMFELHKKYGWSKFIIVVPSIAIREGVKKSIEMTQEHFMEHYGKKVRAFVYNSDQLEKIDEFSKSNDINVMIINTQAFTTSLKEGSRSKQSRIIYDVRDTIRSRRPIDVLRANAPILILDEPQKMSGTATQKALQNFNPLFTLNYSATHKTAHNLIYVLDAVDAYNKKLVKKIEVKGFEVHNLRGTDKYLYLENIVVSSKHAPKARLEFEVAQKNSISRKTRIVEVNDDLYYLSNNLEQYKGFTIAEIDPIRGQVVFSNGEKLSVGDVVGDVSESNIRTIQIRETIRSHFEKEKKRFDLGIKTLSLFFIDEVAKYRQYDANNTEILGEYGKIFEKEYLDIYNEYTSLVDSPYQKYLKEQSTDIDKIHKGYFSIDKKTGKSVDSEIKRGSDFSDDISAYDLILKNKERLLSIDEPTRFIFSHSALREGWDNPNVFQICTLKHSDSQIAKRQEVGRGLRLCVNQDGHRMDAETCKEDVHDINLLTVIASESYTSFVSDLQADIRSDLYDRPKHATQAYFNGKHVTVNGDTYIISEEEANAFYLYLYKNDYIDTKGTLTDNYKNDAKEQSFKALSEDIANIIPEGLEQTFHKLTQSIFDESILDAMIDNAHKAKVENALNDNFYKKEFQDLWHLINKKYTYLVDFDSEELVHNCIKAVNEQLSVSKMLYTMTTGAQKENMSAYDLEQERAFATPSMTSKPMNSAHISSLKYDLVGKIGLNTKLTRKTIATILQGLDNDKLFMFKGNPEEFIIKISNIIKEQKASAVVEHVTYNEIEGKFENSIFTKEKAFESYSSAFHAKKHIQDYVFVDGSAQKKDSVELAFAKALDAPDSDVCVYAKLPRGFYIPTPMGNYSPDWAIAFNDKKQKHIFFVAETKGSLSSLDLRPIEKAKIACAKKLFQGLSNGAVHYHEVTNYENLLGLLRSKE